MCLITCQKESSEFFEDGSCNNIKILVHGGDRKFDIKIYFMLKVDLCSLILHTGFKAQGVTFSANINTHFSLEALIIYYWSAVI